MQGDRLAARDIGERAESARCELTARDSVRFEIEPVVDNDGEEDITLINAMAAKHGTRTNLAERCQLFENEVDELTLSGHDLPQ